MTNNNYRWMKYTIKIANDINTKSLRVAAVLINRNKIVATSYSNQNISWAEDLLIKLQNKKIKKVEKLYLTINTLRNNQDFDLNILLDQIEIKKIFLGLPDPQLDVYLKNDPILKNKNIYRFPEEFQEEIFKQNNSFYKNSKQNIKNSKYFYNHRISHYLKEKLDTYDIVLDSNDILQKKQVEKLSSYISTNFHLKRKKVSKLITNLLSDAFNNKYAEYDYANDIRSINKDWSKVFHEIYAKTNKKPLEEMNIINVGVGSGHEATELFSHCQNITFVDIAPNGLKKIKELLPYAKTITTRAEDLSMLKDNTYNLYISLRTYNSSFFNINQAIQEAYRILKHNSTVIISISNGFLDTKEKRLIPGIIIPKLNFVDLYRGIDIINNLSKILAKYHFTDIELKPKSGEIYLSAKVNKE